MIHVAVKLRKWKWHVTLHSPFGHPPKCSQMIDKSYLLMTQWDIRRAQVNTYTYNVSYSYSACISMLRQEAWSSVAAIWPCNASGRFFIGALRLCKRLSTRVCMCVCARRSPGLSIASKTSLGNDRRVWGGIRRKCRAESWPPSTSRHPVPANAANQHPLSRARPIVIRHWFPLPRIRRQSVQTRSNSTDPCLSLSLFLLSN